MSWRLHKAFEGGCVPRAHIGESLQPGPGHFPASSQRGSKAQYEAVITAPPGSIVPANPECVCSMQVPPIGAQITIAHGRCSMSRSIKRIERWDEVRALPCKSSHFVVSSNIHRVVDALLEHFNTTRRSPVAFGCAGWLTARRWRARRKPCTLMHVQRED